MLSVSSVDHENESLIGIWHRLDALFGGSNINMVAISMSTHKKNGFLRVLF